MTDGIKAFLNSDVGKKAVEAMAQAKWERHWGSLLLWDNADSSHRRQYRRSATKDARAFLSSLAEQGAMREAYGYDGFLGEDNWQTYTSESHVRTRDFPAFILRRE